MLIRDYVKKHLLSHEIFKRMMRGSNAMAWSAEDITLLVSLASDGSRVPLIAMHLGRTKSAVRTRAQKIGLSVKS